MSANIAEAEHPLRCLACGSAEQAGGKWAGCAKCAKCGAAMGLRSERCWISPETLKVLEPHEAELCDFGFKFKNSIVTKDHLGDVVTRVADALTIIEILKPGSVRKVIERLKSLRIPYSEIQRLRLEEPEEVKRIYEEAPEAILD